MGTNHISGTAEAREVKFYMHVGYVKSQHKDDKSPLQWRGHGHMTYFKLWRLPANYIYGTAEARIVKFCTQYQVLAYDDKPRPKWAWSES